MRNVAAYYILYVEAGAPRFVTLDASGAIGWTSCPHAASLWTSLRRAESIAEQWRKAMKDIDVSVVSTRTDIRNVH